MATLSSANVAAKKQREITTKIEEEIIAQIKEDQDNIQKEDLGAELLILERILKIITVLHQFDAF